ncbi:MAG: IS21 family transposase [Comamonadaceae bacterium]|nr:IS21 family transposase [Comamonadaceae bacterium]
MTASRLYAMARERGYCGGPDHFRHLIALHRPRPKAEAYLRLRTLAGEQGQVDWGHFGHLEIGRARRALMAFVMVLSYSRRIYLRFFLDARMENFLRGHVGAFQAWSGLPRTLLYDNLKSAVLERQGDAIRFHPTLLAFAGHYRFEPRPVAVARGNEKGRVERAIRYIRDAFFAGRTFADLADLNAQADAWCRRAGRRAALARKIAALSVRRGLRPGAAAAARATRAALPHRRTARRCRRQDALRALRPERLFHSPHPRAAHAHRGGQPPAGAHPRRGAIACLSSAQLRPRGADRGCGAYRDAGGAQAGRPRTTAPPTGWRTRHRPAATCSCAPPSAARTWARSPPP